MHLVFLNSIGQFLRVGKAITPPDGLFASAQPVANQLPQASALAAATITAQLQAKDIESNSPAIVCRNIPEKYGKFIDEVFLECFTNYE